MPGNKSSETAEAARQKIKCSCAPNRPLAVNAWRCYIRCSIHSGIPWHTGIQEFFYTILVVHDTWFMTPACCQTGQRIYIIKGICPYMTRGRQQRLKILPNNESCRTCMNFIHNNSRKPKQEEVIHQFTGSHKDVERAGSINHFIDRLTENTHRNLSNQCPWQ